MQIIDSVVTFFQDTNIPEQIKDVDLALFTNPWFIVPFAALILYMLYKQSFKEVIIIGVMVGVWWVSGTDYMQTLVVGDELQMKKVLPVVFGGAGALAFVIYLLFGRD